MSPVERRTLIFNRLQTEGKVNLNQIAAELGVSSMTIRRDLRLFVDQGVATISAGTAHLIDSSGGIPLAMIAGRICGQVAGDNVMEGRSLEDYQTEWRRVMLKPLKTAAFNKKLADIFAFHTEWTTSLCMAILGRRRMTNLIQCRRIFP